MTRALAVILCLTVFGAANCDNPCIGMQCPDVPKPDVGGEFDPSADWCAVYEQVFVPECANCHDPSGTNVRPHLKVRGDLTADALVAQLRNERASSPPWLTPGEPDNSHIWARVGEGSMPPGVTMGGSAAEDTRLRKLVRDWIANGGTTECNEVTDAGPAADAGAPADAGTTPEPDAGARDTGPVDTGPPLDPMCGIALNFRTGCHGCHRNGTGGYSTGDGTLQAIRASFDGTSTVDIPYVTSGDSAQSYLFLRIAGRGAEVAGGRATRMPPGGRWADQDITTLQVWIDEGMPSFDCP
jgi:mono/diheme cytochrome c family protein